MPTWPRRTAETLLLAALPAAAAPPAAVVETGLRLGAAFDLGGGRWAAVAHAVCGRAPGAVVRLDGRVDVPRGRAEGMDLAVLSAASREAVGAPPAPPPAVGAKVAALGAAREGLRRAEGTAAGRTLRLPAYGVGFVVRLDAAALGFSGGPVFSEDGRTIGMLVALRRGAGGGKEAFVLPIGEVRAAAARAHLPPPPC
jgi:S1-C subfamily serine protease